MAEVHNVLYGCIDYAGEHVLETFGERDDAIGYAQELCQEQFDENVEYAEEGYLMDIQEHGDGSIVVALLNPEGYEVEWWRVETQILR